MGMTRTSVLLVLLLLLLLLLLLVDAEQFVKAGYVKQCIGDSTRDAFDGEGCGTRSSNWCCFWIGVLVMQHPHDLRGDALHRSLHCYCCSSCCGGNSSTRSKIDRRLRQIGTVGDPRHKIAAFARFLVLQRRHASGGD